MIERLNDKKEKENFTLLKKDTTTYMNEEKKEIAMEIVS